MGVGLGEIETDTKVTCLSDCRKILLVFAKVKLFLKKKKNHKRTRLIFVKYQSVAELAEPNFCVRFVGLDE